MDIKFKRNRAQEYLEKEIDPTYNYNDESAKNGFKLLAEAFYLNSTQALVLSNLVKEDAIDYIYSASVSFLNALHDIENKFYSWATVELYYCMYYLFRTKLHLNNYVIFRVKGMYYLKIASNEQLIKPSCKNTSNTHDTTIKIFKDIFRHDIIFSNTVDSDCTIDWMKNIREIVNYRIVGFLEPTQMIYFDKFKNHSCLASSIEKILNDNTLAFQPEFAMIGLPIILFKEIHNETPINLKIVLDTNRKAYLKEKMNLLAMPLLKNILNIY